MAIRQTTVWPWYLLLFVAIIAGTVVLAYRFYRVPVTDVMVATEREDTFVTGGVLQDGIPSIDAPVFETVGEADVYLKDEGLGLDVEMNGQRRFYPYQLLVWHEVVNDTFNDVPLLVSFCPLTFSGLVYERTNSGETLDFGTSGKLWNNNTLLYDRKTNSLWSQVLGEAVSGERKGEILDRYPSRVMSWSEWKAAYPKGKVLSRETGASRDYTRDPYDDYYMTNTILFPLAMKDARLPLKSLVYGTDADGKRIAYPADLVDEEKIDAPANGQLMFWFAWSSFYPDTELYLP